MIVGAFFGDGAIAGCRGRCFHWSSDFEALTGLKPSSLKERTLLECVSASFGLFGDKDEDKIQGRTVSFIILTMSLFGGLIFF